MTSSLQRCGILLSLLLQLPADSAEARPVTVMPAWSEPADPRAAAQLAVEVALRCPTARHLPFHQLAPILPRWSKTGLPAPLAPSEEFQQLRAAFFASEDWLGIAVRFTRFVEQLEHEPEVLLANQQRREELRQGYLFAARALLQAGDERGAERWLKRLAVRLGDLPGATPGEWGPKLAALDVTVRGQLSATQHAVVLDGPAGWALHIDEQPVGAAPQRPSLQAGPHAVVVVGPDGTRASFSIELPMKTGQAHLIADPRLKEICSVNGTAGLCTSSLPADSFPLLPRLVESDVIVVYAQRGLLRAWRLGSAAAAPVSLSARQTTELAGQLCAAAPTPEENQVQGLRPKAALVLKKPPPGLPRRLLWPSLALAGAGVLFTVASIPYFAYGGRCVDADCTMAYDFSAVAPGLLGTGLSLTVGGGIWLIVSLR